MSRYHRAVELMAEKTTQRRDSTETLGRGGDTLAIVWVYPEVHGRITALASGRTVLGRDFTCDVRLEGDQTSRQHAEIAKEAAMVVIADLDSMNGTYVDGRRVSRAPIDEGSVIRIGDWVGVVLRLAGEREGAVFEEIIPGYFGGPRTLAAVAPLRRAAASDLAVIIEGETGTGKEGIARATHLWSRRKGPFIAVNCAALPEALAEGELFGYRKGAFTSADRANPGFFQAANGGTLFLDEVSDLSSAIQPKLLRVLEQGEVTPLGETKPIPIDVRVVVATQRPLAALVAENRFRADLMARLDGLRIRLLPLRSRVEEVPNLFRRRLMIRSGPTPSVDAAVVETLCCHRWPLNVREVTNLAKRVLALHGHEKVLKRSHLVTLMGDGALAAGRETDASAPETVPPTAALDGLTPADREERQRIMEILDRCAGNQTVAAKRLNMSRSTLVLKLKRYGIRRPQADREA
jgi:transcriptional regulator of acetoin/glycerol metabolism